MTRKPFDSDELVCIGENPSFMEGIVPGAPKFARPITPRMNLKLLLDGKTPYWIPQVCFMSEEVQNLRLRVFPDNVATHLVFDGEPPIEYASNICKGWFDLDWEYEPNIDGSLVRSGNPRVTDINHWEDQVPFPSLEGIDWEGIAKANEAYLQTDNFIQVGQLSGLWERLISLMDLNYAALAMIDDDQKPGIHRLFGRLCDLYDDLIDHMVTYFPVDGFLIHDDWAHQRATFFSEATCREMLLPYMKRIAESCHSRGIYFEQHCCGKAENFVPIMIEAGVDIWCGQPMNDYDMLAHKYKGQHFVFGVDQPIIPEDMPEDEIKKLAADFVKCFDGCRVAVRIDDSFPNRTYLDEVYRLSRIKFSNA